MGTHISLDHLLEWMHLHYVVPYSPEECIALDTLIRVGISQHVSSPSAVPIPQGVLNHDLPHMQAIAQHLDWVSPPDGRTTGMPTPNTTANQP